MKAEIKEIEYKEVIDTWYNDFKDFHFTHNEINRARDWIITVAGYSRDIRNNEISKDLQRLIYLVSKGYRYPRVASSLEDLKKQFKFIVCYFWKPYNNFFFRNIIDMPGIMNLLGKPVLHKINLEKENQQIEFLVHLQELYTLYDLVYKRIFIAHSKKDDRKVHLAVDTLLLLFNTFDKLEYVFRKIFGDKKIFSTEKNEGSLYIYKNIRHSIAHFHIILNSKGRLDVLISEKNKKDKLYTFKVLEEDLGQIVNEMICLTSIAYCLLSMYQLRRQNYERNIMSDIKEMIGSIEDLISKDPDRESVQSKIWITDKWVVKKPKTRINQNGKKEYYAKDVCERFERLKEIFRKEHYYGLYIPETYYDDTSNTLIQYYIDGESLNKRGKDCDLFQKLKKKLKDMEITPDLVNLRDRNVIKDESGRCWLIDLDHYQGKKYW
ncbi:MAG: hypothetical protein ACTSP4_08100 [Candidatus Hodarchaeales archaeon]